MTRQDELRSMPYVDYLQTPEWRGRRNQALARALYRCQICAANRHLQVHHRSYENRGSELESDLVVLCENCHEHFHFGPRRSTEPILGRVGLYVAIVREVLGIEKFVSLADLTEAVKTVCAKRRLQYDTELVTRAIGQVEHASGLTVIDEDDAEFLAEEFSTERDSGAISHGEAVAILERYGATKVVKAMPELRHPRREGVVVESSVMVVTGRADCEVDLSPESEIVAITHEVIALVGFIVGDQGQVALRVSRADAEEAVLWRCTTQGIACTRAAATQALTDAYVELARRRNPKEQA